MKTWFFRPGISLSESQLMGAVVRAIPEIRNRWGFFDVGLRYNNGCWRVVSQPSALSGLLRITRYTSSPEIVRKLAAACDIAAERGRVARRDARRLVGYVPGNRHNYLLELCQALKEAGRSKEGASFEIEQWAQQHGDEDRSYIANLVYGEWDDLSQYRHMDPAPTVETLRQAVARLVKQFGAWPILYECWYRWMEKL